MACKICVLKVRKEREVPFIFHCLFDTIFFLEVLNVLPPVKNSIPAQANLHIQTPSQVPKVHNSKKRMPTILNEDLTY